MNMKFKLTPLEKKWILYDVGNSAFAMLTATILPIYFNYLAKKRDFLQSTTCRTGAMPFQSARCSLQLWDRFWGPLQMSRI